MMKKELEKLKNEALHAIEQAINLKETEEIRIKFLSKKSELTQSMKQLGSLSKEERPAMGQFINSIKSSITTALKEKQTELEQNQLNQQLAEEDIDVTLPSVSIPKGSRHPLDVTIETIEDIFIGLGFQIKEGPEIETDYYNFEALNIPKHHPARDMQDSFYFTDDLLLRTHTSPVQARTLEQTDKHEAIRILCPGKVYRRDEDDATHSHQFMQIEGLVVDKNITLSDLKGTLEYFIKSYFGSERDIRLRPSFFPFTEPSVEVDVSCGICKGEGCRTCKQTGWIEVLGAGMIHPNVLKTGGFDPNEVSGFAFGMGVERLTMLKEGIEDIRHFYTNDLRFLSQRLSEI